MTNKGPIDMESTGDSPVVAKGREVNPDKDETTPLNKEIIPANDHMAAILEHVPDILKERVSKLGREELSMPGAPRDREAYEAYLGAEKMIRELRRKETKANLSFSNVPKQNG